MDIHPWTKYEVARLRDEERLLRARAALRAREARTADRTRERRGRPLVEGVRLAPASTAGCGLALGDGSVGMSGVMRSRSIRAAVVATAAVLVASAAPAADGQLTPALEGSRRIAREVERSYWVEDGPQLRVAEAVSTSVVETVELIPGRSRPGRSVLAENGIYFAICRRAPCALQRHSLSQERALLARRAALELALRTLGETSADLVVVALPKRWVASILLVLTRDDVQAVDDADADDTARRHLYVHGGLVPYSSTRDSLLAFPLEPGSK